MFTSQNLARPNAANSIRFNIAGAIKLVSFRYHSHNYPVKGDTLLVDSLIETRILTKAGIDSVTDILYNNFYKKQPNYESLTLCYFPRNAILFFDKNGKLKESILLCFHCRRHEQSSENVHFGDDCDEKMEKLRQFFISENVKFGIDRNVGIYPGEESDE